MIVFLQPKTFLFVWTFLSLSLNGFRNNLLFDINIGMYFMSPSNKFTLSSEYNKHIFAKKNMNKTNIFYEKLFNLQKNWNFREFRLSNFDWFLLISWKSRWFHRRFFVDSNLIESSKELHKNPTRYSHISTS